MMQGSLAERLRVLRAQRGLTLVEAAEKTGVGRDTLSNLERGRSHPVMPTLAKIARGYGVPVEELLEEPVLAGKAEAPQETGRPTIIDIALDAARRQVALEKQAYARARKKPDEAHDLDQRHANEAAKRLREEYALDANDAEALFDFANKYVYLEEEAARVREEQQQQEATQR